MNAWINWPTGVNWTLVAGRWYWTTPSISANQITVTIGSTSGTPYSKLSAWCAPYDK